MGARQLVVQEAQLMMVSDPSRISWLVLNTMVLRSPVAGAEITTFLAPAVRWAAALSLSVKNPVHSNTTSTSWLPQGICAGSFWAYILTSWPFTVMELSVKVTCWSNLPCAVSYLSRWANTLGLVRSLMATTSMPCMLKIWR